MNKYIILTTLLCLFTSPSHAFRCGEGNIYLATEGMHKYSAGIFENIMMKEK